MDIYCTDCKRYLVTLNKNAVLLTISFTGGTTRNRVFKITAVFLDSAEFQSSVAVAETEAGGVVSPAHVLYQFKKVSHCDANCLL